jgi:hypothetical protein
VPFEAVSSWPWTAEPEIAGSAVFTGGPGATTGEAGDVADALPAEFVAVTTTRSVAPTSAETAAYVPFVAPDRAAHDVPADVQRCH